MADRAGMTEQEPTDDPVVVAPAVADDTRASTSSVPSRPSGESGSVAIVNHRLKSWLRR